MPDTKRDTLQRLKCRSSWNSANCRKYRSPILAHGART